MHRKYVEPGLYRVAMVFTVFYDRNNGDAEVLEQGDLVYVLHNGPDSRGVKVKVLTSNGVVVEGFVYTNSIALWLGGVT